MILPAEALRRRISRVQALVAYLDRLPAVGQSAYLGDIALQLRIERVAQLITQTLVDIGVSVLERKRAVEGPEGAHGGNGTDVPLMTALVDAEVFTADLAQRLADLPDIAPVLVHEFIEIDPVAVWRLWTERRSDLSAAAAAYAAYLTRNKVRLQL